MTKSSTVEKFFRIHLISLSLLLYQKMIPCTSANCKNWNYPPCVRNHSFTAGSDGPAVCCFLLFFYVCCYVLSTCSDSLFVCVHALLCNKKDASTDHKDCTYNVEDCGTHATGFWKSRSSFILNVCCQRTVRFHWSKFNFT